MFNNPTGFRRLLNIVNLIVAAIIIAGLAFIITYVTYEFNRDPVKYIQLTLDKDNYDTSSAFTYSATSCRTAGTEVVGRVSRQFIPVQQVNGRWVPIEGRGPIPLFDSANVTNEKGCRITRITTIIPIMPTGDYQLRINGAYTVLNFLPPSLDTMTSQTVHITESEKDIALAGDLNAQIKKSVEELGSNVGSENVSSSVGGTATNQSPSMTDDNNQVPQMNPTPTQTTLLTPVTGVAQSLLDNSSVKVDVKL